MSRRQGRNVESVWSAVRGMIEEELTRFRARRTSRRLPVLEQLLAAALETDEAGLIRSGEEYLLLTGLVPPGCYVLVGGWSGSLFLSGDRVRGRGKRARATVHRYSPQVWR